ncbi:MAG: HAD family hydrolase [Bacillota bacterium]|nr:HAD family hydrolase [Bacillota bacterium]
MRRFTTVLLDVDGTMVNTIDLAVATLGGALRQLTGSCPSDSELRAAMHLPTAEVVRRFFPEGDSDRLASAWSASFGARLTDEAFLYPGVREGLGTLRAAGFRLGVVTAQTRAELTRTLSVFGLTDFFDATVAVDEVSLPKPAPDSLLRALSLLSATPEEAVYLGDSPSDVLAARRCGIESAAALWGGQSPAALLAARPDHSFPTFSAFVSWLLAPRGKSSPD